MRRLPRPASWYAAAMFRPAPNAVVGGKYRLDRLLAEGGMGSLWGAWQVGLERPVAVKFMARELSSSSMARARFDREAKAAAQLRTPHVVQMHDHGIEDDTPYIVMELLDGEDLNTRLRREKRLPLLEAARIGFQMAKALRRAQEASIVHRDLKPANVFLARADDDEVVKVLDFGIARLTEQSEASDGGESTRSGAVVGSPHYMSPEQARGLSSVDHRSDLWSLAVILFRVSTGALPFPGNELGDIIIRVWNDPAPAPTRLAPDLPPALDGFFERALAKDPGERFQSAPELATAFAVAAGVAIAGATPFDPRSSLGSWGATGALMLTVPTFDTPPRSWPGGPLQRPISAPLSEATLRPAEGSGSTLGGSHALGPRPPSHLPVAVWAIAALVLLGLGAGVLFMALRPSATPPAGAAAGPAAAVTTSPTAAGTGTAAGPGASPAPPPPALASAAVSASSSAASAAPPASVTAPRGGRKGHDFGY
jgi:serine/threonine protein kinase